MEIIKACSTICSISNISFNPIPQRDSSRGRRREKEDIKITKERTPASEEEPTEWEANREGSLLCFLKY